MSKRTDFAKKPFKRVIHTFCPGEVEKGYLEKMEADRYKHGPLIEIKPKLGKADKYDTVIREIEDLLSDSMSSELILYVNDMDAIVSQSKQMDYLRRKNRILKKAKDQVLFIESMPCIEFWFLLHCCFKDRYWASWDELKPVLIQEIPDYVKTGQRATRLYDEIKDQLPIAIERADLTVAKNEKGDVPCSYTYMHELIRRLDAIFEKDKAGK